MTERPDQSKRNWLFPGNTLGKVAVANMVSIGVLCGLHYLLFPNGVVHVDLEPYWKILMSGAIGFLLLCLTFPIGSLVEHWLGSAHSPPILAPVYVPLNAYFWGLVVHLRNKWEMEKKIEVMAAINSAKTRRAILNLVVDQGPKDIQDIIEIGVAKGHDEAVTAMNRLVETGRCHWVETDGVRHLVAGTDDT
ncbi:MAG: hypothetical protein RIK87_22300 [Fuerstiella sp.]